MIDILIVLLIIIFSITIFPYLGQKVKIPSIVIELLMGMIFGHILWFKMVITVQGEWLEFLSSLGFIFLMFLAGMEINVNKLKQYFKSSLVVFAISIAGNFFIGFLIGFYLMNDMISALLLGTVFSCPSIGIVYPTMRELGLAQKKLGQITIASSIILDIFGLAMLSVLAELKKNEALIFTPQIIYSILFVVFQIGFITALFVGSIYLSKKAWEWADKKFQKSSVIEWEMRISLVLILVLSVVFSLLRIEVIIGAFIAGLVMGESKYAEQELECKIGAIGNGFFIPIFFFMVGAKTNLFTLFASGPLLPIITILIVLIAIGSKLLSGFVGARLSGIKTRESVVVGSSMIAKLSIGLAVAEVGFELLIFPESIFTILVILAMVTSVFAPIFTKYIANKLIPDELFLQEDAIRFEFLKQSGIFIDMDIPDPLECLTLQKVKKLMTRNIISVDADMSIRDFITIVEETRHNTYPVLDNGEIVGMIALKDVEKALKNGDLDKKIREYTRSEVLICPDDDLMKAFD
ncbi:MAG: cation:proton antiporter domain-containing protein, partial [Candidatus Helarchaeota archaeon]